MPGLGIADYFNKQGSMQHNVPSILCYEKSLVSYGELTCLLLSDHKGLKFVSSLLDLLPKSLAIYFSHFVT